MTDETDSGIPKLYYVSEIAKVWQVEKRWIMARIHDGRFEAVKMGRGWAMTEAQIAAALEVQSNHLKVERRAEVRSAEDYGGLTRRSWLYHQRANIPGTSQYNRRWGNRPTPEQPTKSAPFPSKPMQVSFKMVKQESDAVIFNMPELTEIQKQLLERVRREGEVVVDTESRKTVESLARRGLVIYDITRSGSTGFRFTLRPKGDEA